MKNEIKKLITEFYTFKEGMDEFHAFPAKFVFEGQTLGVIFAPDQNLLVGELGTAFVWLLASIARECGNNEYGRVAEMEQLVLLGADGKTLGKSVTAKKTSVELLQLGGGLVRVEFVFTKI